MLELKYINIFGIMRVIIRCGVGSGRVAWGGVGCKYVLCLNLYRDVKNKLVITL